MEATHPGARPRRRRLTLLSLFGVVAALVTVLATFSDISAAERSPGWVYPRNSETATADRSNSTSEKHEMELLLSNRSQAAITAPLIVVAVARPHGDHPLSAPLGVTHLDPVIPPAVQVRSGVIGRSRVAKVQPQPRRASSLAPASSAAATGAGAGAAVSGGGWMTAQASWYGPGFYGARTACGLTYSSTIVGVAHKSLPCGTRIVFRNGSRIVTAPVIDRGPYVAGRTWDLSAALCGALAHCYTGSIQWRFP
jgi:hypothetical protein